MNKKIIIAIKQTHIVKFKNSDVEYLTFRPNQPIASPNLGIRVCLYLYLI